MFFMSCFKFAITTLSSFEATLMYVFDLRWPSNTSTYISMKMFVH